jgi:hypothetical protein
MRHEKTRPLRQNIFYTTEGRVFGIKLHKSL